MTIRATISTATPTATAEAFRLALAASRGFTSTLRRAGADVIVVASDGQAVRFTRRPAPEAACGACAKAPAIRATASCEFCGGSAIVSAVA